MRIHSRNILAVAMISLVVYVAVASHRAAGAMRELTSPHFLWGALVIVLILLRDLLGPRIGVASEGRRGFAFQDRPLLFAVCVTLAGFLLLALALWSQQLQFIYGGLYEPLRRALVAEDVDTAPALFVISALLLLVKDLRGEGGESSAWEMRSTLSAWLLLVPALILPAVLESLFGFLNLVTVGEVSLVWSVALVLAAWEGIRARAEARRLRQESGRRAGSEGAH